MVDFELVPIIELTTQATSESNHLIELDNSKIQIKNKNAINMDIWY